MKAPLDIRLTHAVFERAIKAAELADDELSRSEWVEADFEMACGCDAPHVVQACHDALTYLYGRQGKAA